MRINAHNQVLSSHFLIWCYYFFQSRSHYVVQGLFLPLWLPGQRYVWSQCHVGPSHIPSSVSHMAPFIHYLLNTHQSSCSFSRQASPKLLIRISLPVPWAEKHPQSLMSSPPWGTSSVLLAVLEFQRGSCTDWTSCLMMIGRFSANLIWLAYAATSRTIIRCVRSAKRLKNIYLLYIKMKVQDWIIHILFIL